MHHAPQLVFANGGSKGPKRKKSTGLTPMYFLHSIVNCQNVWHDSTLCRTRQMDAAGWSERYWPSLVRKQWIVKMLMLMEEAGANVTKLYMTRTFGPGGESSRQLSPAGAKVPRMELSLQGAKVLRSESSIIPYLLTNLFTGSAIVRNCCSLNCNNICEIFHTLDTGVLW